MAAIRPYAVQVPHGADDDGLASLGSCPRMRQGPRAQNQVLVRQKTGTSCWFAALEMRTYVTASAAITCVEHCRFPRSVAVQAEAQALLAGWPRRPHS